MQSNYPFMLPRNAKCFTLTNHPDREELRRFCRRIACHAIARRARFEDWPVRYP
jgi:hypothetical protein